MKLAWMIEEMFCLIMVRTEMFQDNKHDVDHTRSALPWRACQWVLPTIVVSMARADKEGNCIFMYPLNNSRKAEEWNYHC